MLFISNFMRIKQLMSIILLSKILNRRTDICSLLIRFSQVNGMVSFETLKMNVVRERGLHTRRPSYTVHALHFRMKP